MVQKFNIGDKVRVGSLTSTGVIASYDPVQGYGVDVTKDGLMGRVTVVEDALQSADVPLESSVAGVADPGVQPLPAVPQMQDPDALIGSDTQPSIFNLADGTTLQLGDVVRTAFVNSGLSVTAWNAQPNDQREELIQDTVNGLKLAA